MAQLETLLKTEQGGVENMTEVESLEKTGTVKQRKENTGGKYNRLVQLRGGRKQFSSCSVGRTRDNRI